MTLLSRKEAAVLIGRSPNYLNTKYGLKLYPIAKRTPTGRVFYDKDQILKIAKTLEERFKK